MLTDHSLPSGRFALYQIFSARPPLQSPAVECSEPARAEDRNGGLLQRASSALRAVDERWARGLATMAWAGLVMLGSEIAVRLVPLPELSRRLGFQLGPLAPEPARSLDAPGPVVVSRGQGRTLRALAVLARHWPPQGQSCLRHAVAVAVVLRRHHCVVHLGVSSVAAHAWVAVDGVDLTGQGPFLALHVEGRSGSGAAS